MSNSLSCYGYDQKRKPPIHKKVWRKFTSVVQSNSIFCTPPGKATSKTYTNNNDDVHSLHDYDNHHQLQPYVPEMKGLHFAPPTPTPTPPRQGHCQEIHRGLYYRDLTCNDRRIVSVAVWDEKGNKSVAVDASDNNSDDYDKEGSYVHNNDDVNAGESSSNSDATKMKLEGIDAKAEEFINNFKQHLRIQRAVSAENAVLEFYQMLARSA